MICCFSFPEILFQRLRSRFVPDEAWVVTLLLKQQPLQVNTKTGGRPERSTAMNERPVTFLLPMGRAFC
jgi:hypothetical protein